MVEGFVVVAVVLLAAVLFAAWFTVRVITWIVSSVFGLVRGATAAPSTPAGLPPGTAACRQVSCRAANPQHARFCRRCGIALVGEARSGPVRMRYVA